MKIYISGGISGLPTEQRKQQFATAAAQIRTVGHEPVNPFECIPESHNGPCPRGYAEGESHSSACHLKGDILALLDCDGIYMLDGWELSRGARLEHSIACDTGKIIWYPGQPFVPSAEGYNPGDVFDWMGTVVTILKTDSDAFGDSAKVLVSQPNSGKFWTKVQQLPMTGARKRIRSYS